MLKLDGYNVTITPEALMLAPFKALWNRDKSKNKGRALAELAFIFFVADPRSDYQYIVDVGEREIQVKQGLGLDEKWEKDDVVKRAIKFYESFKPSSAGLLEDTRVAVNKLRELLRNIDLEAKDDKGKPIYTLNTITATIKQIPGLVKDLDEAERTLSRDIMQESKARGSQTKSIMEDEI